MIRNKAVFLDRDGILIEDTGFPGAIGKVIIIEPAIKAVKKLNESGFEVIVISNQSAVARGFIDETEVQKIHKYIYEHFYNNGANIDDFYYCPHLPNGTIKEYAVKCECRKPKPGLIFRAADEHGIDLGCSFFIGDSERDMLAASSAGVHPIFVNQQCMLKLDVTSFTTLEDAVNYILENK